MIIKVLRSFLTLTGVIILGTCFLVFLVLSFLESGYDLGKIFIGTFSVILGMPVVILFFYLIRRKEWVALFFTIYFVLIAVIFPLAWGYFKGSPGFAKIGYFIDVVGMEAIILFLAVVPFPLLLRTKNRYILQKISELFDEEKRN